MAQVVIAPGKYPQNGFKVYLAGAIDMGDAENWQQEIVAQFIDTEGIVLLNPRRPEFTNDMEQPQIEWELTAMEDADIVAMWLPATSKAPVSLLEMGLYMRSGKLLIGLEDGYYRQKNVELTARRYNVPIFHSLNQILQEVKHRYATRNVR